MNLSKAWGAAIFLQRLLPGCKKLEPQDFVHRVPDVVYRRTVGSLAKAVFMKETKEAVARRPQGYLCRTT